MKTEGMYKTEVPWGPSWMNMGEVVSQTVYPRASKVVRIPPEGNDDASGSAWSSCEPEKASMAVT
jgi:hypothetical protein